MDAALNHLRATGADVKKEDLARLSPLSHKHFNILGRYHFAVPEEVLRGELRPLRNRRAARCLAQLFVPLLLRAR
jgi:Tn3 transposase DDE domain